MKKKISHTRIEGKGDRILLRCANCGIEEWKDMPDTVDAIQRISKPFIDEHKKCKPKE